MVVAWQVTNASRVLNQAPLFLLRILGLAKFVATDATTRQPAQREVIRRVGAGIVYRGVDLVSELIDMIVDNQVIGSDVAGAKCACAGFDFGQDAEDLLLLLATDGRIVHQYLVELAHVKAEQRHFGFYLFLLEVNKIAGVGRFAYLSAAEEQTSTKQRE